MSAYIEGGAVVIIKDQRIYRRMYNEKADQEKTAQGHGDFLSHGTLKKYSKPIHER